MRGPQHLDAGPNRSYFRNSRHDAKVRALRQDRIRGLRGRDKEGIEGEGPARTGPQELLMKDILDSPGSGVSERYVRVGLSAYQGNLAKGRLLEKDLIQEKEVRRMIMVLV